MENKKVIILKRIDPEKDNPEKDKLILDNSGKELSGNRQFW